MCLVRGEVPGAFRATHEVADEVRGTRLSEPPLPSRYFASASRVSADLLFPIALARASSRASTSSGSFSEMVFIGWTVHGATSVVRRAHPGNLTAPVSTDGGRLKVGSPGCRGTRVSYDT